MTRWGIVGSEAAKFTPETEARARQAIRDRIRPGDVVVSGQCHLGGVDVWAVEEAIAMGCDWREHPAKRHQWSGPDGYMARNLAIVRGSDRVVCITVRRLPPGYTGMRFDLCYHCGTDEHVKSGGCWTAKQARLMGKPGETVVI